MHTSSLLISTDFRYSRLTEGSETPSDFDALFPKYHPLDRVGVVSPYWEDGIFAAGYALLALTTAFYDAQRERSENFFDYPHHFAFLDADADGVLSRSGRLPMTRSTMGAPWGELDVWPESNWIAAPGTVTGMLQAVFERQITRLFWPEDFTPGLQGPPLPDHVLALLKARLTNVCYYKSARPTFAIHVTLAVEHVVRRSRELLPHGLTPRPPACTPARNRAADAFPYVAEYRPAQTEAFLADVTGDARVGDTVRV
ncbi:MAG TPA: hypothetical protein VGJ84_23025 [Polyangiaceae bacterium]|jgi:hypothetical protein